MKNLYFWREEKKTKFMIQGFQSMKDFLSQVDLSECGIKERINYVGNNKTEVTKLQKQSVTDYCCSTSIHCPILARIYLST